MSTKEEVQEAIIRSLKEWGVDPKLNKTHKDFHERAVETAVKDFLRGTQDDEYDDYDCEHDPIKDFPKDMKDSIRYVLEAEVKYSKEYYWFQEEDTLDCFFPPYYVRKDGKAIKKPTFSKLKQIDLDPFTRFTKIECTKEEYYFRKWFDKEYSLKGYVFEAIVACHVIHKEACFSCKAQGKLAWNGQEAWKDIECLSCGSAFEVKTKESLEKVNDAFKKKHLNGGSYHLYHRHRRGPSNKYRKQFVVVVSRQWSMLRNGRNAWLAYIAEIQNVIPLLCHQSFDPTRKFLKIKTSIEADSKSLWASIPTQNLNYRAIAKDVFLGNFSLPVWNNLCARQKSGWKIHEKTIDTQKEHELMKDNTDDISMIRNTLQDLKVNDDDDWETCYSD